MLEAALALRHVHTGLAHSASLTVLSNREGTSGFSSAIVFDDVSGNPDLDGDNGIDADVRS